MNKILTFTLRHSLGDCTNNGLTSQKDSIDMYYGSDLNEALNSVRTEGILDELPEDSLILIERNLFGKPANYAVPVSILKKGQHSMSGGNFVYTSDSRFPSDAPISVHDRVENN
jgi:hypothetical protein